MPSPAPLLRAAATALALALALAVSAPPADAADLLQRLQEAKHFNAFLTLVDRAGLTAQLQAPGPLTVFAPTDEAFIEMEDGGGYTILLNRPEMLRAVVGYHLVPGDLPRTAMADGTPYPTLQGKALVILQTTGGLAVNETALHGREITASNGTIHQIKAMLRPPGG